MNQLQLQQNRLAFAIPITIFHFLLNPVLLVIGIAAGGAGHGDATLWYLALGSCFLFNLTLLLTVAASYPLRTLNRKMAALYYVLLTLFVAYGSFSIWVALNPEKI